MIPYYEDDAVKLFNGDAVELLPLLRADLIVTSPPYNRGARVDGSWEGVTTEGCKGSRFRGGYDNDGDALPWGEYREWLREVCMLMWRAVEPDGAMWINHKPRVVNGCLWMPTEAVAGLPLRQIVIWNIGAGVNINPGALAPAHEWIMLVAGPDWRLRDRTASALGDVWNVASEKSAVHPAPFPLGVPTRCLMSSPPGVVLDPFAGIGTTLVAAKSCGQQAVGIERSKTYCAEAAARCSQETLFAAVPAVV